MGLLKRVNKVTRSLQAWQGPKKNEDLTKEFLHSIFPLVYLKRLLKIKLLIKLIGLK